MVEKNIKSRIVHKHDTEANWIKATNFTPKQGEIIIYDIDSSHSYERFKIGDGATKVSSLPFADANKVDKISGKGLSTNDYTTDEKNKLSGIATGANKTIVDSTLSSSSTNPVQNKVVNTAISNLQTLVGDTAVSTQISNAIDKITVDSALSSSSTNSVQNKAIYEELTGSQYANYLKDGIGVKANYLGVFGLDSAGNYTFQAVAPTGFGANKIQVYYEGTLVYTGIAAISTRASGIQSYTFSFSCNNTSKTLSNIDSYGFDVRFYDDNTTVAVSDLTQYAFYIRLTDANDKTLVAPDWWEIGYTLPTASSTLGGVKTTSTVSSTTGLTATPIIDGVPYYKDTTYTAGEGVLISNGTIINRGILGFNSTLSTLQNGEIGYEFFHPQVQNRTASKIKVKGLDTAAYHPESYFVPATREINGYALSEDLTLTADDVGADFSGAATEALSTADAHIADAIQEWIGDTTVSAQISTAVANKADKTHTHNYAGSSSAGGAAKVSESDIGITTAGTGSAYTATVNGITALTAGVSFVMIPHVVSASTTPTLNVNGLGAKSIKRRLSSLSTSAQVGYTTTWLAQGVPFRVTYDGIQWIVEGLTKPAVADLYGTLAVDKGGTGATTAEGARTNLGITDALAGYLPLGGGTLTGTLTAGASLCVKGNNYPELLLKNANGANLASLYTDTTTGAYSDVKLRVYADTDVKNDFIFGASSGTFTAPGTITGNYLVSRANSYPAMRLEGINSNATLASLTVDTTAGSYGDLRVDVYSSESASVGYEFRKDGTFWCNALEMDTALSIANGGTGAGERAEAIKNLTVQDGVITNADNHLDIGFYTTNEQTTSLPYSTYGILSTYKPSQEWVVQTWTSVDKAKGELYMRKNINGEGFGNWFKVMTEDNTISISHGGTGATTASGALANLAQVSASPSSCFITYANLRETGIVSADSTTEAVALAMNDNTSVMFVHNKDLTPKLTDAPTNYNYIQLGKGYNDNYIYGWCYGTNGQLWSYSRHSSVAGKWRMVYNETNVIYSSSQPSSPSTGAIWLKPV